jgi:hypothetical protein
MFLEINNLFKVIIIRLYKQTVIKLFRNSYSKCLTIANLTLNKLNLHSPIANSLKNLELGLTEKYF